MTNSLSSLSGNFINILAYVRHKYTIDNDKPIFINSISKLSEHLTNKKTSLYEKDFVKHNHAIHNVFIYKVNSKDIIVVTNTNIPEVKLVVPYNKIPRGFKYIEASDIINDIVDLKIVNIANDELSDGENSKSLTREVKETNGFFLPEFSDEIDTCIKNKEHMFFYGPQGCGKTQTARILVSKNFAEFEEVDFSAGMDEASFLGSMVATTDENRNNITKFEYGSFSRAMKNGIPIIVNEVDAAQPAYMFCLHGALDYNDPKLVLLDNHGEVIKPKEGFFVIATANTVGQGEGGSEFTGTNQLNAAFLDRFTAFFKFDYTIHEPRIIANILEVHVSGGMVVNICDFINAIRLLKTSGSVTANISTRRLIMVAKKIKCWGLEKAIKNIIINGLIPSDAEQVAEIAQRYFGITLK